MTEEQRKEPGENAAENADDNPGESPAENATVNATQDTGGLENVEKKPSRRRRRRELREEKNKKRRVPWFVDLGLGLLIALVISACIKAFLMQPFVIPSESMEDTLQIRDHIMVSKLPFAVTPVRRGDIVVFEDRKDWLSEQDKSPAPTGFRATALGQGLDKVARVFGLLPEYPDGYLVKRVIGIGGDTVHCCNDAGQIEVNGKALQEPYLKKGQPPYPLPFDVKVPEGKIWVQGDNRNNSSDSRYHQDDGSGGFIDLSAVTGRAFFRYYPLSRIGTLSNPGNFPPGSAN